MVDDKKANKKKVLTRYDLQVLEHQRRLQKEVLEHDVKKIQEKLKALEEAYDREVRRLMGEEESKDNDTIVWGKGKWKWKVKKNKER